MYKNLIKIFLLFIFCIPIYSQNYQSEKDTLRDLKNKLAKEINVLKSDVDSLRSIISARDSQITKIEGETAVFKKKLYYKKYGKVNGQRVLEGKIWKGMSEDMLQDIWGKPDKTNTDKHPWGVFTQWHYGDITYFFKNSILIDWEQESK